MSAPDSSPTNRSTSATCGSKRRVWPIASSAVRALRQRVTHGCWLNSSRKPQWTTSWSSTIRTESFRPVSTAASVATRRHHQPDLPLVAVAGAELHEATGLERLAGGQPQAHAGAVASGRRRASDTVVHDVEHEDSVTTSGGDRHDRRVRVLLRIAQTLAQN